ncbi:MAG: hypothetical protein LBO63_00020 [Oscillospiraceae bacterium]|jgi:hypothetical protein|nr:hypothetical protein [Oscillospiraceae bacterium]
MARTYKDKFDALFGEALKENARPDESVIADIKTAVYTNTACIQKARPRRQKPFRVVLIAACIAAVSITTVLAANGTIGRLFSSENLTGGAKTVGENGYAEPVAVSPGAEENSEEPALELRGYYIDAAEIGVEMLLKNSGFPESLGPWEADGFSGEIQCTYAWFDSMTFELTTKTGEKLVFTNELNGNPAGPEVSSYPGGHREYLVDEDGDGNNHSLIGDTAYYFNWEIKFAPLKNGDWTIDLIVTWPFLDSLPELESVSLKAADLKLMYRSGVIAYDGQNMTFYEKVFDFETPEIRTFEQELEFNIDVADRFSSDVALIYAPVSAEAAAELGIVVDSISVLPTRTAVLVTLDIEKSGMFNASSIQQALDGAGERGAAKFRDLLSMSVGLSFKSGDVQYINQGYSAVGGDDTHIQLKYTIDSMFFDKPEEMTMYLYGDDGNIAQITVKLAG